jgi:hypothetical protein
MTQDTDLTDRVCAWCRAQLGRDYFELIGHQGEHDDHTGRVFCTRDCLVSALMDPSGGVAA